ncbi:MAG: EFR1 family ferrodoxin [Proteobacteria bacterium]|jgi:ferredoxin|nr:EFR1 family ferrodoxin [Pseudomonadota bacterium]
MPYARLTCYYLSGTGNSFRAARWLAEAAEARGVESAVIPIDRAAPKDDLRPGSAQLVGIYHPAHGLMPPWSMIKFLLRMPLGRGAHAAIVSTRGGIRVGRLVLPGAAGLALWFPLLVLLLKGYRVRAGLSIDMPVNVINLHWGLAPHNVEHIKAWGRRRHARLVDALLGGRRFWHPVNVAWEAIWAGGLLWLWPIFPIAYLLVGRVTMGKIMFADTRCKGCGLCAKYCPNGAIVMRGEKPRIPFWTYHCEACLRCMGYCRQRAVEASHLWLTAVILATMFLTAEPLRAAIEAVTGARLDLPGPFWQLASVALSFPAILLLYYPFFGMQRIRPLRVALGYLTWTRAFKRRHHDPETELRQLR